MKNTFVLICFLAFTFSCAFAQIKKGNMQLGGSLGYSRYNQNQTSINQKFNSITTSWSILPSFGYFITENSSLGLSIGFDNSEQSIKSDNPIISLVPTTVYAYQNSNSSNQFLLKPYYRLHKVISQNFVLFAEVNAFYGFGNRMQTNNTVTTEIAANGSITSQTFTDTKLSEKQNTWGVGLNPGIIFFPHEKWGIDVSVGLLGYSEVIGEQSNNTSNLTLQPSFNSISLGLKYYIIK